MSIKNILMYSLVFIVLILVIALMLPLIYEGPRKRAEEMAAELSAGLAHSKAEYFLDALIDNSPAMLGNDCFEHRKALMNVNCKSIFNVEPADFYENKEDIVALLVSHLNSSGQTNPLDPRLPMFATGPRAAGPEKPGVVEISLTNEGEIRVLMYFSGLSKPSFDKTISAKKN